MKKGKTFKKNSSEKEKILEELAESIKNNEPEQHDEDKLHEEKESELEEDLDINLRNLEFHQFMQPSEAKAPVLERIAESQPRPIFVGGIPQGPISNTETEEKDEFKYIPGQNTGEEPKYLGSDSRISAEPRHLNIIETGRRHEIIPEVNQQAFFERTSEIKNFQSQNVEMFERAERFDTGRAGRKEEREEVKYEKYKPKLPKSY